MLAIRLVNSGVMAADAGLLFRLLSRVTNDNAKGEYYLTSVVGLARGEGLTVRIAVADEAELAGVNSQAELAAAEGFFQDRRRAELMAAGVSMTAPQTVWLSWDTMVAAGVMLEPNIIFGPGVSIKTGAQIRGFCHIEGAEIEAGAIIGPYARLRPGAVIGEGAHIGNFVEVKKVKVGAGAKANHLAYLGDGAVGAGANIGAGTIFCNYDGFDKFDTYVGEGAFIGSNSALVAPVTIGAGAYTGSGSVITRDVAADALALGRGLQTEKPGWASRLSGQEAAREGSRVTDTEAQKRTAGEAAAALVEPGMTVGLGTGSTAAWFVRALAERRPRIDCVATSEATAALAASLGLRSSTSTWPATSTSPSTGPTRSGRGWRSSRAAAGRCCAKSWCGWLQGAVWSLLTPANGWRVLAPFRCRSR